MKNPRPVAGWLRVHVSRTVGQEAATEERAVFCPFRSRSVPMSECAACGFRDGLSNGADGKPVMVLCSRSLVEAPESARDDDRRVRAAAVTPVATALREQTICVRPEMTVEAAAYLFLEEGMSGAPVVDAEGFAIGVISKTDILREWSDERGNGEVELAEPDVALEPGFHVERLARSTVKDIMNPVVLSLPESAPISKAAALMAYEGVHRLPLTGLDGRVTGLVSSLDILRWLARHDGYQVPERTQRQT